VTDPTTLTQYATRTELAAHGLPDGWLTGVTTGNQDEALQRASDEASGYMTTRYTLPLTAWGRDLTGKVCDIAAWYLMKRKGFNPADPACAAILKGYDDAIAWLKGVASGAITPVAIVDSTTDDDDAVFTVGTDDLRGW
jgi:phage gp36-like protein